MARPRIIIVDGSGTAVNCRFRLFPICEMENDPFNGAVNPAVFSENTLWLKPVMPPVADAIVQE